VTESHRNRHRQTQAYTDRRADRDRHRHRHTVSGNKKTWVRQSNDLNIETEQHPNDTTC